MKNIINLLEDFFEREVNALMARRKADMANYNEKLKLMNELTIELLKNSFGMIPAKKLYDESFYERAQKAPPVLKRHLFRIDEYKTSKGDIVYTCMASGSNPKIASLFSLFIVGYIDNEPKIFTKFTLSDNGMGGDMKWFSGGGDERFEHKVDDEFVLNETALGEKTETLRLQEPVETDIDGLKEYNKD
ncbi:hypothetical protein [Aquimarina sp. AU474]|uniref:hypothetical protein n=1 Tax=Aquimarina sp. AU474 TaxID=2108529 RepID=UPI000D68A828|nr:hypothetical protein [Aquimarina sp. AU474]